VARGEVEDAMAQPGHVLQRTGEGAQQGLVDAHLEALLEVGRAWREQARLAQVCGCGIGVWHRCVGVA